MSIRLQKNGLLDKDVLFVGKTITMSGINTTTISADTLSIAGTVTFGSGSSSSHLSATNALVSSGLKVMGATTIGNSGTAIPRINVIAQLIDLAQVASGINTYVQVAFTSGAAGTVSSGDYCIPLGTPVASGVILTPAQTTTGDSIRFAYTNMSNVDVAAGEYKFLILHQVGV